MSRFLPWAYRFAHFKMLAHRKKNRRLPALLQDDVLEILAEEQLHEDERLEAQLRVLPRLPGKTYRRRSGGFSRCGMRGGRPWLRSPQETGRLTETLYRVLHRVRKKLLHCIERRLTMEEG